MSVASAGVSASDRSGYAIRRYGAAQWRQLRDIRLEMLADSPLAYVEPLSSARQRSGQDWRDRAAWAGQPHRLGVAGVLRGTGRWIGLACGSVFDDRGGRPFVFSVYVAPDFRGRGLADDLLQRVEGWAREQGHPALFLYVHQANARAAAFYQHRGYHFTGARETYPLDRSQSELEMRLPLH